MEKPGNKEELMIRYLLGQLPDEEQVRLEEQFFTDEETYQQLLALEDELRYDYATGELTPNERKQFQERFLVTPEDRKKLAFAGALISQVALPVSPAQPAVTAHASRSIPWRRQLSDLLNLQSPVVRYSLAGAVLVVALGAAWLVSERFRTGVPREMAGREQQTQPPAGRSEQPTNEAPLNTPTPSQEVVVEQRPPQQSSPGVQANGEDRPVPAVATFLLTPGLVRDAGEPGQVVIQSGTDRIRLQLSLRRKSEHSRYRAVLRTLDGVEVWKRSGLSARQANAGQAVVAQLPAKLLAAGDYELVLQGATPGADYEDVAEYYFRIVKK